MLFRVVVFIPPGPVQEAFGEAVATLGLAALNASAILGAAALAAALALEDRRALRAAYAFTLAVAALNLAGVAGAHWALIALAPAVATVDPRRAPESLFMLLMVLAVLLPSAAASLAANVAWLLLPLAHIALVKGWRVERRWVKRSAPFALLALAFAARDPYIASQVLIFAMGLLSPWYLAPATLLYAATGSIGMLGILLTGPGLQLSFQPIVISGLYALELLRERGGVKGA
jgi:hypothetical protein